MIKLVIGNKNYSSWSFRPWLLLTYHNIPFEEVNVSLNHTNLSSYLRQFSPSAKVPVLIDGELTVWDSLAICEYVSEQYLDNKGWPTDLEKRILARTLACEMHAGFIELRTHLPMNIRAKRQVNISQPIARDLKRIDEIFTTCRNTYQGNGPWLLGEFSIIDCMYAPVVMRLRTYGIELSTESMQYIDFVNSDSSVQQWVQGALKEKEILEVDEAGEAI